MNYLQRLMDRLAQQPQTTDVEPSGISTSPIALADQRLNEPDLTESLLFEPLPPDLERDGVTADQVDTEQSSLTVAHPRIAPRTPEVRAGPQLSPEGDSIAANTGQPVEPASPPRAPAQLPEAIGHILESDFVPAGNATGAETIARDPVPHEQRRQADSVVDESESGLPIAEAAGDESEKVHEGVATTVEPVSVEDRPNELHQPQETGFEEENASTPPVITNDPITTIDPIGAHLSTKPLPAQSLPEPAAEVLPIAEPPELSPPPTLPSEDSAPPPEPSKIANVDEKPPIKVAVDEKARTDSSPKRVRPMTASEASIIGGLEPRPRAVTLFGLRRR